MFGSTFFCYNERSLKVRRQVYDRCYCQRSDLILGGSYWGRIKKSDI